MKRALVPLAPGFEEIEAVTVIDLLRRAGVEVVVAGVSGGKAVAGSHGITLHCDVTGDAVDVSTFDALVLPGGPGTRHLMESAQVRGWATTMVRDGKLVTAICAAPTVLESCGLLRGRRATSHPNHAAEMRSCRYEESAVVKDGTIITSRGAGTAVEFAAALVSELVSPDAARDVLDRIVYVRP